MTDLKYPPVPHDHPVFLTKTGARLGLTKAYTALALDNQLASQMRVARAQAGWTQDAVAPRKGTTQGAVSRLESAGKHAPSLATLKR